MEGNTDTRTSSIDPATPSLAVSRNRYSPAVVNPTEVASDAGDAKVTAPGPLIFVHANDSVPGGVGLPSSVALPTNVPSLGSTTIWSAPALTEGAVLPGPAPR